MKPTREVKVPAPPLVPPTVSGTPVPAPASAGRAGGRLATAASRLGFWNADLIRPILVTLAAAAWLLGPGGGPRTASLPGSTLISPAEGALVIWFLLDAALTVYVLYQWLPSQRRRERQRRLGWTVASALLLLTALRLSGQADLPILAAAVSVLLLGVLLATLRPLNRYPTRGRIEGAAVNVPLGLLLGWVIVEVAVRTAALVDQQGVDVFDLGAQAWALIAVGAVTVGAAVICMTGRGHVSLALAVSWGLVWILIGRLFGETVSAPVAFAAGLGTFLLLISAGSRRHRVEHHRRRRLRAVQDAARPPLDLLGG